MIQRFVPFLGRPTYALAAVLFVLLCAGGAGSRLFGFAPRGRRVRWLALALLLLIGLVALVWVSPACRLLMDAAAPWPVAARIALVAALLLPLGLLLGMPFPAGLAAVSGRAPTRIPWLWAVNSATSVLGSVGATLVAIHLGIRASTIVGVGFYALALAMAWIVCRERAKTRA